MEVLPGVWITEALAVFLCFSAIAVAPMKSFVMSSHGLTSSSPHLRRVALKLHGGSQTIDPEHSIECSSISVAEVAIRGTYQNPSKGATAPWAQAIRKSIAVASTCKGALVETDEGRHHRGLLFRLVRMVYSAPKWLQQL